MLLRTTLIAAMHDSADLVDDIDAGEKLDTEVAPYAFYFTQVTLQVNISVICNWRSDKTDNDLTG